MKLIEKDGEWYLEFSSPGDFCFSVTKFLLVVSAAFATFYALWLLAALFDK